MNENIFWELIDKARIGNEQDFEEFCITLTELLKELTAEEIIAFQNIYTQKEDEASGFNLLMANYIIYGAVSDELFDDFRAWLIGQGNTNFYKALKDPNTICDFLEKEDADEISGDNLLFVPVNAFVEVTGKPVEEYYPLIQDPKNDIACEIAWTSNTEEYRNVLPQLFDKFWNQEKFDKDLW